MNKYTEKVRGILKIVFICSIILLTIFLCNLPDIAQMGKQSFDMGTAILLSCGFGASICLFKNKRKKYKI